MAFLKGPAAPPLPTKDILSWIFDEPAVDTNKPIFIDASDTSRSLSLAQAKHVIQQLVAGLRAQGVKPGDCVLIDAFNDIYYMMLALAIIGTGAIFAGCNPAYTPFELTHHIKITSATWIIAEPEILPTIISASKTASIPSSNIIIFHPLPSQTCPPGYTSWLSLLQHGTAPWLRFDAYTTSKTTTAARFTSSGTSGLPKATINTHLNLIAQHEYNYSPNFYHKPYAPVVHLWSLPMFHAAVAPRALTSAWKMDETAYIMRRFDVDTFARHVPRFGVTELFGVPPMFVGLLMHPAVASGEISLRSIRGGNVGAAPLTRETQARITALLGAGAKFTQVWGMTESNCLASRFPWGEGDETGSVGYLCPGMEGKLVDVESGREIREVGVRGEFCVRGESVVPGYYNSEAANRKSWDEDGFYHSGDVMYVDGETGKLYIVDRVKELIKVRGFQVAPPELEGVLLDMPGLVDAAVIGVREKDGEGEACRAYVIVRPGWEGKVSEQDVYDWVKGRLVKYKHLDGGVKIVQQIPKTPSGKILKRLLREEYEREQKQAKL